MGRSVHSHLLWVPGVLYIFRFLGYINLYISVRLVKKIFEMDKFPS